MVHAVIAEMRPDAGMRPDCSGTVEDIRVCGVPVAIASSPDVPGANQVALARILGRLAADWPATGAASRIARLALAHDAAGRPILLDPAGEVPPAIGISFSHAAGRCWVAASAGHAVGIDAASAADFAGQYPYHRVFTDRELAVGQSLNRDDLPQAAAALWAMKEAAVKALGGGFNSLDYREAEVIARIPNAGDMLFAVSVRRQILGAWARRQGASWLAVAVTDLTTLMSGVRCPMSDVKHRRHPLG